MSATPFPAFAPLCGSKSNKLQYGPPRQGPVASCAQTKAGAYAAPVPRGRDKRPCTRCATYNRIEQGCFRMLMEETKSDSNTGTMKTIKIAVGKIHFPTAYFFVFPGCLASGGRPSAAGPCAAVPQPIRNIAICFFQGISACFVEGRRQFLWPCGPAPFTQGRLSLLLVSAGYCLSDNTSNIRYWVQSRWPCWVQGRCPWRGVQGLRKPLLRFAQKAGLCDAITARRPDYQTRYIPPAMPA